MHTECAQLAGADHAVKERPADPELCGRLGPRQELGQLFDRPRVVGCHAANRGVPSGFGGNVIEGAYDAQP